MCNIFYQYDTDGFVDTSITPITPNTPALLHIIIGPSSSNIYPHTHIHCFKRHTIKPDNGKEPKKSLNLEKVQTEREGIGGGSMCPVGGFGWRAPRILWGVKSIVEESRLLDFGFIRPQTAAGISLLILVHTTHSYRPCKAGACYFSISVSIEISNNLSMYTESSVWFPLCTTAITEMQQVH